VKTYTLDVAFRQICGDECDMKDPHGWMLRQIRSGKFRARKIGHRYFMTQAQIDAAVEAVTTRARAVRAEPAPAPAKPKGLSLTRTSARQLRSA